MDFTSTYAHALWDSVLFSPGSTFLAYIAGKSRRQVLVRVSGTLQVVRSWELDVALDSLSWSSDGLYLLASSKSKENAPQESDGVSYVLPLDPDTAVTDGSDDHLGWVARVAAGVQGLVHAAWIPLKRIPCFVQFSGLEGSAVVYSLADQGITILPRAILPQSMSTTTYAVYSNSNWPEHFIMAQREKEKDCLLVFRPSSPDAPTLDNPVVWEPQQIIHLPTHDVAGVAWSPDGHLLAAWDSALEYRLSIHTLYGTHLATFTLNEDGVPYTETPLSRADVQQALAPSPAGRGRRITVQSSQASKRASISSHPSPSTQRVAGGGLGIRQVSWHPSSEFLALGGYDEQVHILHQADWSLVYSLDFSTSALRSMNEAPQVWLEPHRWFEATRGQGIVSFESSTFPIEVPTIRTEDAATPFQNGIQWMQWNQDGTLLACTNQNLPTVLFVHEFVGWTERRIDAYLRPLAMLVFSHPVESVAWRPSGTACLAVATGQQAVFLWTIHGEAGDYALQVAEAVAIPNSSFSAHHLSWSPDGQTLVLLDAHSFCCVVPAPAEEDVQLDTAAPY
ncbi:hypothetical protein MNAN1_000542 [Malassezia nana]|uniref:WD repeat-containing protein WRAP73 n=1 Tax=Malassezia nana TaxID=180528 RepID=A0AAF0J113_9BASI|nr:hypothetical protein MNAN1_000542 [Malassezia nana]